MNQKQRIKKQQLQNHLDDLQKTNHSLLILNQNLFKKLKDKVVTKTQRLLKNQGNSSHITLLKNEKLQ